MNLKKKNLFNVGCFTVILVLSACGGGGADSLATPTAAPTSSPTSVPTASPTAAPTSSSPPVPTASPTVTPAPTGPFVTITNVAKEVIPNPYPSHNAKWVKMTVTGTASGPVGSATQIIFSKNQPPYTENRPWGALCGNWTVGVAGIEGEYPYCYRAANDPESTNYQVSLGTSDALYLMQSDIGIYLLQNFGQSGAYAIKIVPLP